MAFVAGGIVNWTYLLFFVIFSGIGLYHVALRRVPRKGLIRFVIGMLLIASINNIQVSTFLATSGWLINFYYLFLSVAVGLLAFAYWKKEEVFGGLEVAGVWIVYLIVMFEGTTVVELITV